MLFVYDALGNLTQSGYDADDNNNLTVASSDRLLVTEQLFVKESNFWFFKTIQSAYATTNNGTATTILQSKEKLSGLPTGTVAETQHIDVNGNVITDTIQVDRANRKTTLNILYPFSTVAQQEITVNGLLQSSRTPSNLTTTYSYDALGRVIGITDPRIGESQITYYSSGSGKIGKLCTQTDAAGNMVTYDYESTTGLVKSVQNALNQKTYYTYNNLNQVVRSWGDCDYPMERIYDSQGQLTHSKTYRSGTSWSNVSWPGGNITADVTQWTYDAASGLVKVKTDPAGKSISYIYNPNGTLQKRTWARQSNNQPLTTTYTYNVFNELIKIDYSDTTPDITITYDRLGRPLTVADAVGTRIFTYNAQLALQKEAINGIYTKELIHNYATTGMKGRSLGMNIGNVNLYTYGYDQYGRLNQVSTSAGAFNYVYLANSDLIASIGRPNSLTTSYTYDDDRNLLTKIIDGSMSTLTYLNDALGRRTSVSRTGSVFSAPELLSYTYDARSELAGASSNNNASYNYTYTYDPIGNRKAAGIAGVNWTYTANNLNQYTALNKAGTVQNPTYDADGNMLTRDGWTQTWNAENRLIKAEKGSAKLEFVYDYMGRRVEKKVYNGTTLTSHIRFVYDGYKLVEELNGLSNNAVMRRYTWQPVMMDVPLTVFDAAASKTYTYHADANKNITDLTDSAGVNVAHYEYSPFGQLVKSGGSYAATNVFTWSGEYLDRETGLVYYNFREYDPLLGRWLSRDPIGENGGINLYAMSANMVTNVWDNLGLLNCAKLREDILNNDRMMDNYRDRINEALNDSGWGEVTTTASSAAIAGLDYGLFLVQERMENLGEAVPTGLKYTGYGIGGLGIGMGLYGAYQAFSTGDITEGMVSVGESLGGAAVMATGYRPFAFLAPPLAFLATGEAIGRSAINIGYGIYIAKIEDETNQKMLEGYGKLLDRRMQKGEDLRYLYNKCCVKY